jgi:hypothetical protein
MTNQNQRRGMKPHLGTTSPFGLYLPTRVGRNHKNKASFSIMRKTGNSRTFRRESTFQDKGEKKTVMNATIKLFRAIRKGPSNKRSPIFQF